MVQKIQAVMIIEVAGRPPEYLSDSLKTHIAKIDLVPGVRVLDKKFATPKKLNDEKDLYTAFAEVEVEAESMQKILDLVFEFMPSSIEILEPAEVVFNIQETTNFLSDLAARLHKYDDLAKIAKFQIQELSQRLQQFQKPIVKDAIQPIKITMDAKKEVKKGKVSKSKKK